MSEFNLNRLIGGLSVIADTKAVLDLSYEIQTKQWYVWADDKSGETMVCFFEPGYDFNPRSSRVMTFIPCLYHSYFLYDSFSQETTCEYRSPIEVFNRWKHLGHCPILGMRLRKSGIVPEVIFNDCVPDAEIERIIFQHMKLFSVPEFD